jgi:hypothetical protein
MCFYIEDQLISLTHTMFVKAPRQELDTRPCYVSMGTHILEAIFAMTTSKCLCMQKTVTMSMSRTKKMIQVQYSGQARQSDCSTVSLANSGRDQATDNRALACIIVPSMAFTPPPADAHPLVRE